MEDGGANYGRERQEGRSSSRNLVRRTIYGNLHRFRSIAKQTPMPNGKFVWAEGERLPC